MGVVNYTCVSSISSNTDNPTATTTTQHQRGDVESWRSFCTAMFQGEVSMDFFKSRRVYGKLVVQVKF